MARSAYKGGRDGKLPVCAICEGPGQGERALFHMTGGVRVWLCEAHRSPEFLTRRAGRDLAASLLRAWRSLDCLDARRSAAVSTHLRRVGEARRRPRRPGSYSWPSLRAEAERRFAAGESPRDVIADLRKQQPGERALVPSLRTMQRWFADGRWLDLPPDPPPRPDPAPPAPPPPPAGFSPPAAGPDAPEAFDSPRRPAADARLASPPRRPGIAVGKDRAPIDAPLGERSPPAAARRPGRRTPSRARRRLPGPA
jgi:hypothetical protein